MPLLTTECDLHGELNHSRVHITYTRFARVPAQDGHADPDFLPADRLHLVHGATERIFSGEQIAVADTAVGQLVTVELPAVPDLGTTSMAILVPDVTFPTTAAQADATAEPVHTIGLQVLHKSSLDPRTDVGQVETYSSVHLHGQLSRSTGGAALAADNAGAQPAVDAGATA